MNKWPGSQFWGSLHPAGAQNEPLTSNTVNPLIASGKSPPGCLKADTWVDTRVVLMTY